MPHRCCAPVVSPHPPSPPQLLLRFKVPIADPCSVFHPDSSISSVLHLPPLIDEEKLGVFILRLTMAETAKSGDLKYLGLVHALVLQAAAYLVSLYNYAKDSSGPLKPSVDNVEGTVKTVVGPVYQKVEGKPYKFLQYVDSKFGDTLNYVDGVVPKYVKDKSCQALDVAKQAPDAARSVVADVQSRGVYSTASFYYERYEPVAEQLTFEAWQQILKVPFVPQAVNVAAPAAKFGALHYNSVAKGLKSKNLPFAAYLPVVPIERIEKAHAAAVPASAGTVPSAPAYKSD